MSPVQGRLSQRTANPDSPFHTVVLACLVAILSYLCARLGGSLVLRPQMVWPVWPGCAFLVAVLLLTPRKIWPILMAAGFAGFVLYDLQAGLTLRSTAFLILADTIEILIAALGVAYSFGGVPRLDTLNSLVKYSVFAVILAPITTAFISTAAFSGDYWLRWNTSFFTEALALLTLTPAILTGVRTRQEWAQKPRAYYLEAAALVAGLILLGSIAFVAPASRNSPVLLYSLLPFLLWSALRFGLMGISTSMIVVAFLSTLGAVHGRGPFTGSNALNNVMALQLFLFFAATPFMVLAVLVEERKQTEQSLRESERRFQLAAQAGNMFAYEWDAATDVIVRSAESNRILGIDQVAPVTGQGVLATVHPDDRERLLAAIAALSLDKPGLQVSYRMVRPDGSVIWLERNSCAQFDAHGKLLRIVGMVGDITERKLAEYEIARVNDRLRLAMESGKCLGWEWDLKNGRDVWFGDLQTMFGVPSDTFVGRTADFYRYVHPEDRPLVARAVADARQSRKPYEAEFRVVWPDGTVRWVASKGKFHYSPDGEAERMLGMAVDITEQRHTEASLRLFRKLMDESNDAIEVINPETLRFLDVNEKACRDLGYTRDEFLSLTVPDIDPTVNESLVARVHEELNQSGFVIRESLHRRKDGSFCPVEVNLKRVRLDRTYIVTIARDITERRRTEEALRESEQRFRLAVQAGRMYAFDWDTVTDSIVRSGECTDMFNWMPDPKRDTGREFYARVHPDDREVYIAAEAALTPENPAYQVSFRVLPPDGGVIWLEDTGRASFDPQGRMLRVVGMVADVTERKRGEELLRQREAELTEAQRLSGLGSWQWDARTDRAVWSEELCRLVGHDPSLPAPPFKEHSRLFTAESWDRLQHSVREALETGTSYQLDMEIVRPDFTRKWGIARGEPVRDASGQITGLRGTVQDITEHKHAEVALAQVSRKLIAAQEQERRRIARELHDDIGQRLAMLTIEIEELQHGSFDLPAQVSSRIGELKTQASDIATDIQSLSHELHSAKLEYLGITTAMRGFCNEFGEQQKLVIDFQSHDLPSHLPPETSLCLFRVLQEALNNSAKHSGVLQVEVRLWGTSDEIRLTVSDRGVGFDSEKEKERESRGLGLISMEERLKLVNGTLSVESQAQHGTTIHARVPLVSENHSRQGVG
jgi:PAS domain S-box-containing protein